jgi:peptidoglycan/xylan/chitin deacetylase (PgdA/CDA1 family)
MNGPVPSRCGDRHLVASPPAQRPHVVLTFDDAVSNHATFVAPLLAEYGFGATFFITEFEGAGDDRFATDKHQYLTWDQIRQLDRMGFEIGNHTATHCVLTEEISTDEIDAELLLIEQRCQAHGIARPTSFAYPNGHYEKTVLGKLKSNNFRYARIVDDRPYIPASDNPLLVPSYSICDQEPGRFEQAMSALSAEAVVVLTFHGIPDHNHPWVTTHPRAFLGYMDILRDRGCTVTSLREMPHPLS